MRISLHSFMRRMNATRTEFELHSEHSTNALNGSSHAKFRAHSHVYYPSEFILWGRRRNGRDGDDDSGVYVCVCLERCLRLDMSIIMFPRFATAAAETERPFIDPNENDNLFHASMWYFMTIMADTNIQIHTTGRQTCSRWPMCPVLPLHEMAMTTADPRRHVVQQIHMLMRFVSIRRCCDRNQDNACRCFVAFASRHSHAKHRMRVHRWWRGITFHCVNCCCQSKLTAMQLTIEREFLVKWAMWNKIKWKTFFCWGIHSLRPNQTDNNYAPNLDFDAIHLRPFSATSKAEFQSLRKFLWWHCPVTTRFQIICRSAVIGRMRCLCHIKQAPWSGISFDKYTSNVVRWTSGTSNWTAESDSLRRNLSFGLLIAISCMLDASRFEMHSIKALNSRNRNQVNHYRFGNSIHRCCRRHQKLRNRRTNEMKIV